MLVVRVHPEFLERQQLPGFSKADRKFWKHRFEASNEMEHHLVRSGTLVLKFFLNLSKEEQRRRFMERIEDPRKNWKFSEADCMSACVGTITWMPTKMRSSTPA